MSSSATREQMATMIVRAADKFKVTLPQTSPKILFSDDALIASYAKDAVYALQRAGIVGGTGGGMFSPQGISKRGDISKVIYMVLDFAEILGMETAA